MTETYLRLQNWLRDDEGQGLVEYGLIIALVAIVIIVALTAIGTQLNATFTGIKDRARGLVVSTARLGAERRPRLV